MAIAVCAAPVAAGVAGEAEPGPGTASAGAPAPAGAGPNIAKWLNRTVRLEKTVQAVDQPSSAGKPAGEIRAGSEIEAIGLVAGGSWVQVELPDRRLAYVPKTALEVAGGSPGAAPSAPRQGQPETPPTPAAGAGAASAIRGAVQRVPNAATLVVGDRRIRLAGIDPGPSSALGPFESWVKTQGDVVCEPEAQTGRYRCFNSSGVDVAEAAILNGAGRVGDGATREYRASETQAREQKRGLWGQH